MGRERHDAKRPKLLSAALLVLALSGLLIFAFACTELTSNTGSTTSASTTMAEGVTTGTTDALASDSTGGSVSGDEGEPAGGGGDPAGGGGSGPVPWGAEATDTTESSGVSLFTVVPFETSTSERCPGWPSYCHFDESNNGETWGMTVGDRFYVALDFSRTDGVADAVWAVTLPPRLDLYNWQIIKGRFGISVIDVNAIFDATAPGSAGLMITMLRADGSTHSIWQLHVEITE